MTPPLAEGKSYSFSLSGLYNPADTSVDAFVVEDPIPAALTDTSATISSYLLLGIAGFHGLQIKQSGLYEDEIVWGPHGPQFALRHLTMDGIFD